LSTGIAVMYRYKRLLKLLNIIGSVFASVTTIAAPANTALASTNRDIIAAVRMADKSLSQGVIVYSIKSNGKPGNYYNGKIIYLPNGQFEEDLEFPGTDSSSITYWDGENEISQAKVFGKPTNYGYISINPAKPLELDPDILPLDVRPGPSFPLGRGLSLLKNLQVVSATRGSVTITGIANGPASPPAVVTAELDPRNDFIAKRIEIEFPTGQDNKTFSGIWTFGSPMKAVSGQIIASSATYDVREKDISSSFVIHHADFAQPTLSIPTSIPAGNHVADMRAGRQVVLSLPHTETLDQILTMTRQQAAQMAAMAAQERATEEAIYMRSIAGRILMIVLAATIIAQIVLFLRRRRHPADVA
jgi:hypothetical protein